MENESKSYEAPPQDLSDLDSAGATQAINKLNADGAADENHPYLNGNHIQHSDYADYMNRLWEIKGESIGKLEPLEKDMQAGFDIQAEVQNNLIGEAEKEMELLTNLGFEPAGVPADIPEWKVQA